MGFRGFLIYNSNMITVAEMLRLHIFDGYEILAGADGLGRSVSCVDYLEVPTSDYCVTSDIFLFSTTYTLQEYIGNFDALIEGYNAQGSSGLGVKLGWFLSDIPPKALETADRLNFPVVKLPMNISYVSITREVMAKILKGERKASQGVTTEGLFERALFGDNAEETLEELERFGWMKAKPIRVAYTRIAGDHDETTSRLFKTNIHMQKNDEIIAILPEALETTESDRSNDRPIGVSRDRPIKFLRNSLHEARRCFQIAVGLGHRRGIFTGEDMGLLLALTENGVDETLREMTARVLTPLKAATEKSGVDLIHTLRTWLACDRSIEETSGMLFIHRNTLRYRLKGIDQIVPLTTDNIFTLRLALLLDGTYKT